MLCGRATLGTTLRGLRFEASPHAFLQTNTAQTEVLYRIIAEAAGETWCLAAGCHVATLTAHVELRMSLLSIGLDL